MATASVGYATLQIIPSMQGVDAAITKSLAGSSAATAAGASLGKDVEKGIGAKSIGQNSGKALAVGIGATFAAGLGAFKLGETFDAAFDEIRVGTGATGTALEGLQDDFRAVFKAVPAGAADVGTAIADLNTRLGRTGEPLQFLAEQFLDLSRITGTDLASNIEQVTRVFGDWNIAGAEQAIAMDKLYRAAQASGIGLDQLQTSVVQFGAPLRNLGFGFDEAVSLLAQFDKAGVNTETAFAGLKVGVGTLAKAGEDVPTTFRRIVDEITALGPGSEATAKAIQLFGQRAGPDLADAIAGGKFEIDAMVDAVTNGSDTISTAAADTEDFAEKWKRLVNGVLVALEPAASAVFEGIGAAVEGLTPFITSVSEKFAVFVDFLKRNPGVAKGLAIGLAAIATALGGIAVAAKVIGIIKGLGAAFTAVRTAVLAFNTALLANPIFLIIAGIVALGVAIFAAYKRFEGFRKVVDAVGRFLRDSFLKVLDFVKNWWATNGPKVIATAKAMWEGIKTGAQAAWRVIQRVAKFLAGVFTNVVIPAFNAAWKAIQGIWNAISAVIVWAWQNVIQPVIEGIGWYITNIAIPQWELLWKGIQAAWNVISEVIGFAWRNVIQPLFDAIGWYIANVALPFWETLWKGIQAAWNVITEVAVWAWQNVLQPLFDAIAAVITNVVLPVWDVLWKGIQAAWNVITEVAVWAWQNVLHPIFQAVGGFITDTLIPAFERGRDIITKAWDLIGKAVSFAWENVIKPVWEALRSGIEAVATFIGDRIDDIIGFFQSVGGRIGDAFSTIADVIREPLRSAFNFVVKAWNNTIGKLSFSIPDIPGLPGRGTKIEMPRLREFHTGGLVPGRPGEEVLIKALAGERVLSPAQTRALDSGPGREGDTFVVNQENHGTDPNDTARRTIDAIKAMTAQRQFIGAA
ncbi:MAG: phage tail tape measure protein [Microthrixaceae bacterium]